jgi:pimeloyl-ACP methyl ester carboxylesterase
MRTSYVQDQEQTIRLRDGRLLGYAEFGDPSGVPLLFCHGWGDSRLTRHPDDACTAASGIRLITIDRPGFGRSDFQPRRTLLDWPVDIVQLADTLKLERFALLGHSGGGPHALACAVAIPDRLSAVGIACGFAPMDRPDALEGMSRQMQQGVGLFRRMPWMARLLFASLPGQYRRNPEKAFEQQFGHGLPEADRAVLSRPDVHANVLAGAVEALRGGARGLAHEAPLFLGRPWGFRPEDIRTSAWLWYGDADSIVPVQMGHYLAQAIPQSQLTIYPGEGHMLHITHWDEILQTLAAQQ